MRASLTSMFPTMGARACSQRGDRAYDMGDRGGLHPCVESRSDPLIVDARRTRHELDHPEPIPAGTDFACILDADVPVVVQHTRLDSRQAENALVSTIAYAAD